MIGTKRPNRRLRGFALVPIVCMALGGFLLIVAMALQWNAWWWVHQAVAADGTVLRLVRMPMPDGAGPVKPVIGFITQNGQAIEFDGRDAPDEKSAPAVGTHVAVLYDPRLPTSAIADQFSSKWLFPAFFAGLGGGLALIGVLMHFFSGRRREVLPAAR